MMAGRMTVYPRCDEVNYCVDNVEATVARVFAHHSSQAVKADCSDGFSVESRGDIQAVKHQIELIEFLIIGK